MQLTVVDYGRRLEEWLRALQSEAEVPTSEQFHVLRTVKERLLLEFRLEKEGSLRPKGHPVREVEEQPLLVFCHGSPGAGKSRVINWICRMFKEALGWKHEDEFLCVAFQNRVAQAMGGNTLHSGGDIDVGGQRKLEHTDIDILYTRNQYMRWVIIDELPMVADDLLGALEHQLTEASVEPRYKFRADKSARFMGGYNLLAFGDFYQIPLFQQQLP